jgi:hypothetical protein
LARNQDTSRSKAGTITERLAYSGRIHRWRDIHPGQRDRLPAACRRGGRS